jgi:hypothetical protein
MTSREAIPAQVLRFVQVIQDLYGHVCIAGSAPLTKYIRKLCESTEENATNPQLNPGVRRVYTTITNSDIDIFVPLYPHLVSQCLNLSLQQDEQAFSHFTLEQVLTPLMVHRQPLPALIAKCARKDIALIPMEDPVLSFPTNRELPSRIGFVNIGASHIYNIKLSYAGYMLPGVVQLIFVYTLPKFGQSWPQYIISTFDINVCKCILSPFGKLEVHEDALSCIMSGEFKYEVQPCKTFLLHLRRIFKYIDKGFVLKCITFHPMCSNEYKNYFMHRLQNLRSPELANTVLTCMGLSDTLIRHLLQHVLPFLQNMTYIKEGTYLCNMFAADRIRIARALYYPTTEPTQRFNNCLTRMNNNFYKKQALRWMKIYWMKRSHHIVTRKRKRYDDCLNT